MTDRAELPREELECSYCLGGAPAIARVESPITGWDGRAACALHLGQMIAADEVSTDGLSQAVLEVVAEAMAEYD